MLTESRKALKANRKGIKKKQLKAAALLRIREASFSDFVLTDACVVSADVILEKEPDGSFPL